MGLKIRVDRVIYTTITLLSVLIIYDGWEELQFWNVVTVIVGPILAIFLGHVFGAALGGRVAQGRPLTRHERRAAVTEESRFLLIAVPPLAILVILTIAGVSYPRIIQVVVLTGVFTRRVGRRSRTASRADRLAAASSDLLRPVGRGIILSSRRCYSPGKYPSAHSGVGFDAAQLGSLGPSGSSNRGSSPLQSVRSSSMRLGGMPRSRQSE